MPPEVRGPRRRRSSAGERRCLGGASDAAVRGGALPEADGRSVARIGRARGARGAPAEDGGAADGPRLAAGFSTWAEEVRVWRGWRTSIGLVAHAGARALGSSATTRLGHWLGDWQFESHQAGAGPGRFDCVAEETAMVARGASALTSH